MASEDRIVIDGVEYDRITQRWLSADGWLEVRMKPRPKREQTGVICRGCREPCVSMFDVWGKREGPLGPTAPCGRCKPTPFYGKVVEDE